jgi:prephenate dehydrogenase
MKVGIIGLGLIGGSMAIDLKKSDFATKITGYDKSELHAKTALHLGIVDELGTLEETVKSSELVILAIPADATVTVLPEVLDLIDHQIVTDVCSVKGNVANKVNHHLRRSQYVAAHPMAGTEHTGPWAALSGLFDGKATILCDVENSGKQALQTVLNMYDQLHMRPVYMNSVNHDAHAAYVSHISHISSFALALTVLDKEQNEKNIFDMASGGFDSTVRLAKSSADMWTPIFTQNAENVVTVLNTYIDKLEQFRKAIKENDETAINELITKSNNIKKVLS